MKSRFQVLKHPAGNIKYDPISENVVTHFGGHVPFNKTMK